MKSLYDKGIINIGNPARIINVMQMALAGIAVKVGFIGGSITAGSLASTKETSYAYRVYSWWVMKFPLSEVSYINAGIGATTSQFGVARVHSDLLQYNPDMIFAEFSVNDSDNDKFQETFEGLISSILRYETSPALMMFNNVEYDSGNNAQRVHNEVGIHYKLPIVSVKDSIYEEIVAGNIEISEITPDNLHPSDYGHELVAGLIINLLEKFYTEANNMAHSNVDMTYELPRYPLTLNRYYNSVRRNSLNTEAKLEGFYKDLEIKEEWDVFRNGWTASNKGAKISLEVEATFISIQFKKYAKHPAPIAKVTIDGDKDNSIILDGNFDEDWGDCLYLQDIMQGGKAGLYTVDIEIIEEALGVSFYLASIITA